jgi:hypothetical protein
MNAAFLAPTIPTTLLSLCYMQKCVAHYCPDPARSHTHSIISSSATGFPLNNVAINSNNLLPVNFTHLRTAALNHPNHYQPPNTPTSYLLTSSPPAYPHITGEQRHRADQAEALHHALGHPADATLSLCISTGKIPTPLVPSDILLNRTLRGHCVHCAAGKYRSPPHPSSTSAPASNIGQTLSFDPQQLPQPAALPTRSSSSTNTQATSPSLEPSPKPPLTSSKPSTQSSPPSTTPTATKSHLCTATQRMLTTPSQSPSAPSASTYPTPFPATTPISLNVTSKLSGVSPTPCSHPSRTTYPHATTSISTKQQPPPATLSFPPKAILTPPTNSFVTLNYAPSLYHLAPTPSSSNTSINAKQTPDSTTLPLPLSPKLNLASA